MEMPKELQDKLVKKLHEEADKSLKDALDRIEQKHLTFVKLVEERGNQLIKEFKEKVGN
ncbi:MAG: hypothetical protein F7C82_01640 [Desulfurococcales archaeon]|nr:hypothetical protein [Desulfurococcales archaeon]MCE4622944.1 hypothetical protein [Desulfurococcales archaeon]MCE4627257.1 hypothetical protein [Desulfurococcales archaeon]MCE4628962.1 hypothetical protein [Desulfurococcales archaeon]